MDGAKKRERKANFSDEEVRCLLEGIEVEKDAINCKLHGTITALRRKEAWARVCTRLNAVGRGPARKQDDLAKKWRDLKSAVLKEQTYQTKTGSGGPTKETPFKELILNIIGDRSDVSGIEVTDSFLAASTRESLLENEEEDSSTSWSQQMASTSNTADHRVSEDGTGSKLKRKRRSQSVSNTGDELLDNWLPAETETNPNKKALRRSQINVNRSQIEVNRSQIELNRSQIELNAVLRQESLLRIKHLQARNNSGQN